MNRDKKRRGRRNMIYQALLAYVTLTTQHHHHQMDIKTATTFTRPHTDEIQQTHPRIPPPPFAFLTHAVLQSGS